jgi:hypothetical protein
MSFGGSISQLATTRQTEAQDVRKIVERELLSLDGVAEAPDS